MKHVSSTRFFPLCVARLASALALTATGALQASVVRSWNAALAEELSAPDTIRSLPLEARAHALMHLAMADAADEAARSIGAAAVDRAANAAAHEVVTDLLPRIRGRADAFQGASRGEVQNDASARAESVGRDAARRWLRARANDGWAAAALGGWLEQSPDASESRAAAVAAGAAVEMSPWLALRPMSLRSVGEVKVRVPEFVAIDGAIRVNHALVQSSLFKRVRRDLPAGRLQQTWEGSPVRGWNRIARSLTEQGALSTTEEARLFATMNVALADACIGAAHWRFVLGTWRTTIVEVWEDGRGPARGGAELTMEAQFDGLEPGLVKLVQRPLLLPPRLNYPSVAAALAGAANRVLNGHPATKTRGFTLAGPGLDASAGRVFAGCEEAAREAAFVASLEGGQGATSAVAGFELGGAIGRAVMARRGRSPD